MSLNPIAVLEAHAASDQYIVELRGQLKVAEAARVCAERRAERAERLAEARRGAVAVLAEYIVAYDPESAEDVDELLAPLVDAELELVLGEGAANV